ncbi:MAG: L,D-transpeptidase [Pseudomonadota bacterium]
MTHPSSRRLLPLTTLTLCAALLGTTALAASAGSTVASPSNATVGNAPPATASADVQMLVRSAIHAGDNKGQAFAVVDKNNARLFIYRADGTLSGTTPVLLGAARGDDSVPGIGERPMAKIKPSERTTPAGRFVSEPGRNMQGEDIVWVDYDAAVSMHRVRTSNKSERRAQRLASPSIADNRISYGCINVPAAFYDAHVKPALGNTQGVIYVLPEKQPIAQRFGFLGGSAAD